MIPQVTRACWHFIVPRQSGIYRCKVLRRGWVSQPFVHNSESVPPVPILSGRLGMISSFCRSIFQNRQSFVVTGFPTCDHDVWRWRDVNLDLCRSACLLSARSPDVVGEHPDESGQSTVDSTRMVFGFSNPYCSMDKGTSPLRLKTVLQMSTHPNSANA